MATIGTFKKTGNNEFSGEIVTLSPNCGDAIAPARRLCIDVPCSWGA